MPGIFRPYLTIIRPPPFISERDGDSRCGEREIALSLSLLFLPRMTYLEVGADRVCLGSSINDVRNSFSVPERSEGTEVSKMAIREGTVFWGVWGGFPPIIGRTGPRA